MTGGNGEWIAEFGIDIESTNLTNKHRGTTKVLNIEICTSLQGYNISVIPKMRMSMSDNLKMYSPKRYRN